MSTEGLIVTALLILLVVLSTALIVHKLAAGRGSQLREYQNQGKNIFVQNGVDVKRQMLGSGKGEYFSGNLGEYDTNYMNGPAYSAWKISFQDLKTGSIYQLRFCRKLLIGRSPVETGEAFLVLKGDSKVSKRHCIVYEGEGRLCLADQNSSNHTFVNGKKVQAPVFLNVGDVIKVGDTKLKVEFGK